VEQASGVTVAHNIFSDNGAARFGGGAALVDSVQTAFVNNTVYRNTADWWGGGLYLLNGGLSFQNNIVSANAKFGVGLDGGTVMQRQYNNFYANSGLDCYRCPPGLGELATAPQFVDTTSFRLAASSPNVDSGNPEPAFDDRDGSRNDIGAYGGSRAGDIPVRAGTAATTPAFDPVTSTLTLPDTDLGVGATRGSLQMRLTSCVSEPGAVVLKLATASTASPLDAARGVFYRHPYLVIPGVTVAGTDYDAVLSHAACAADPDGIYGRLEALAPSL
jgi:hypothetical protein